MVIEERILHDVTVLDLKGQMTLGEGDEMLKDKCNSIMASGRRKLVLNLGAVPYIDSAGLGEIVRSYTLVSRLGGKMWLSYPTKRISDLLSITKLEGVFGIAEPEELVGALADERLVAWCPICTPATRIPLRAGPEYQVCGKCGVQLKLSSWPEVPPDSEVKVDCAILRVATYDDEYHTRRDFRLSDPHRGEPAGPLCVRSSRTDLAVPAVTPARRLHRRAIALYRRRAEAAARIGARPRTTRSGPPW